MITERQRAAYAELLRQLGDSSLTDTDAVIDALYTLATCGLQYIEYKHYEKDKRSIR